jgi:hypothetical protein
MNAKRISMVSGATLLALTATASAGPMSVTSSRLIAPPQAQTADSDDVGHLLRLDVGHLLRFEAGRRSDLMSATLSNVPEGRNG